MSTVCHRTADVSDHHAESVAYNIKLRTYSRMCGRGLEVFLCSSDDDYERKIGQIKISWLLAQLLSQCTILEKFKIKQGHLSLMP